MNPTQKTSRTGFSSPRENLSVTLAVFACGVQNILGVRVLLKEARMIVFHLRGADNGVDFFEHVAEIVRLLDRIDDAS